VRVCSCLRADTEVELGRKLEGKGEEGFRDHVVYFVEQNGGVLQGRDIIGIVPLSYGGSVQSLR